MNDVCYDFLDKFVVIYLDNLNDNFVVISAAKKCECDKKFESVKDHLSHLEMVFSRLRENQLHMKKEKCEFARTKFMFLGYRITNEKAQIDGRKVQAVLNQPPPTRVLEFKICSYAG